MGFFELPPRPKTVSSEELPPLDIDDFADKKELYTLLKRFPKDLIEQHLEHIENLSEEEALAYVHTFAERRENAKKDFLVSDLSVRTLFEGHEREIQDALETRVFNDEDNFLGEGQTARVKRFRYRGQSKEQPMAIKYLLHPREGTLPIDQEHNLLAEVEQLHRIEGVEKAVGATRFIKVPHPYFYYKKGAVQCYGMEEVDGVNLAQFRDGKYDPALKEDLKKAFEHIDRKELEDEVRKFFDAMHSICLHGDIFIDRPGNIMVSRTGAFYVIDFGESTRASGINEQLSELYSEEQEKETLAAQTEILKFLDVLYADT